MHSSINDRSFADRLSSVVLSGVLLLMIHPVLRSQATEPSLLPAITHRVALTALAFQGSSTTADDPDGKKLVVKISPPWKPRVALSSEHRDACLVVVGDKMPAIELPDLNNKQTLLKDTYGKKLTVVLFWNAEYRYAREEFQHLQTEVVAPFQKAGVSVIAIHTGNPPDDYAALCQKYGGGAVCLLDKDQRVFHQIATGKLPRTYLLDAQGNILWLDLEYSRTTRLELHNALRYFLQDRPVPK